MEGVGLEFHFGHIEFSCLLGIQVKMWKIRLEAGELSWAGYINLEVMSI